ncbi:hypothetical protein GCM10027290_20670 [Micromonospora sonneratiae]
MTGAAREAGDALYTTHPDGFVAARDEAVASLRAAGDQSAAREVAKLRKPTVAAWLVNLLALRRPELVADLVELSAALRTAQRDLRGPQLRELSAQRRDAVNALVAEARTLASEATTGAPGGRLPKLPLAEVEATLNAALADPAVAGQVRSGRLVRAVSYAGFGEVPRPQLRLLTGGAEEPPEQRVPEKQAGPAGTRVSGAERAKGRAEAAERARAAEQARAAEKARVARNRRRQALAKELSQARTWQEQAEAELDRARATERDGARVLAEVEAALADLERRRTAAEADIGRYRQARRAAERAAVAARRRTGEVEAAVEALDAGDDAAGDDAGDGVRG